ncbi:hypothetical protein ACS8Y6_13935 [Salinisphaera sp. RV14]|uniref:hypothetical protein n=1 Tax=Salinisphaera sp. RV14 TaxID=3454140 RepID=UPI003F844D28
MNARQKPIAMRERSRVVHLTRHRAGARSGPTADLGPHNLVSRALAGARVTAAPRPIFCYAPNTGSSGRPKSFLICATSREGRPTMLRSSLFPVPGEVREWRPPSPRSERVSFQWPDKRELRAIELPMARIFTRQVRRHLLGNAIEALAPSPAAPHECRITRGVDNNGRSTDADGAAVAGVHHHPAQRPRPGIERPPLTRAVTAAILVSSVTAAMTASRAVSCRGCRADSPPPETAAPVRDHRRPRRPAQRGGCNSRMITAKPRP